MRRLWLAWLAAWPLAASAMFPSRPGGTPGCHCFDCTKQDVCMNSGGCVPDSGTCNCIDGFGGEDCSKPLDGSIAEGHRRLPRSDIATNCSAGFGGLLCNVCQSDDACVPLVPGQDGHQASPFFHPRSLAGGDDPQHSENGAVCYKGGFAVQSVHQMCDVTNRKILDMLPNRKPQVTFACHREDATCNFQFWVGGKESFYCGLDECSIEAIATKDRNATQYTCNSVQCRCIPDRMLCGESGSVDISDFLVESIKGPGKFTCRTDGQSCKFEEPEMNNLINDIFGDGYITLGCDAGECMHYSLVPGFVIPPAPDNSRLVAVSIAIAGAVLISAALLFWYLGRTQHSYNLKRGAISLPTDEADKIMADHIPATLHFSNISYSVNGKQILSGISGSVRPGQIMAIMGASGAGKSTFLDILARKSKRGVVEGDCRVNGRKVQDDQYKRVIGFVDQEDTLMSTLTVYETILYSALLRLPRDMSYEAKRTRVLETMQELGILEISDSRIGETGKRSISGGEKRRVSIACELVTSPSILYLDEPTSGLDSYNARNVIESLVQLAKTYNRTVVFTIHQPRSNIVAMFDKLLLLASGRTVYSGDFSKCHDYFSEIGHPCPAGYNIADFLIDLTMQEEQSGITPVSDSPTPTDEEEGTPRPPSALDQHELRSRTNTPTRRTFAAWARTKQATQKPTLPPALAELVSAFEQSQLASDNIQDIIGISSSATQAMTHGDTPVSDADNTLILTGYKRASLWTQFRILSGRAFKNLYRNPHLMLAHYILSGLLAIICSFLFRNVTNDIPGFQNRMGLFFFIIALFGFSSLTSLGIFASERILFMRERANGYYSPLTYFLAKVLFDIIPLRVVPPFVLGAIIYRPVGLVPTVPEFWKLILVLILFNLAASSVVFLISIVISDGGLANLVGSLVMLFNLLYAGLLINRDKMPTGTGWLQQGSFFHAAFEALLVNEVRYLTLKEHRYGVDIEVPSATILSFFGFRAQAFWWPDVGVLVISFGVYITLAYLALLIFAKERR